MKVTPDVLKDYVFGELDAAGRRAVEAAVAADAGLAEELQRLQMTQTALFSLREEEMPRRIAFVSDKVFEPKWWQAWLAPSSRLGFASAGLLAGAIVFHAVSTRPAPPAPAPVVAAADPARFERMVKDEVARLLPAALAEAETRHRTQLASALKDAETKYERMRREDVMTMEASYALFREKQAALLVSFAQSGGGGQ